MRNKQSGTQRVHHELNERLLQLLSERIVKVALALMQLQLSGQNVSSQQELSTIVSYVHLLHDASSWQDYASISTGSTFPFLRAND